VERAEEGRGMKNNVEWDARYRSHRDHSLWPWSDVVSYVMRHVVAKVKLNENFHVLELGCGMGANIPFLTNLGAQYFAIEQSEFAVESIKKKFPGLRSNIVCANFTEQIPFEEEFDLVIDRSSLTHNSTSAIQRCLRMIYQITKPRAWFIGVDWFSTGHGEYTRGDSAEDAFTRKGFVDGQFAGVGQVHFSTAEHLLELFHKFNLTALDHKQIDRVIPPDKSPLAVWNFVAEKKSI
jgi:SAM-dependent methyltransferase